MEKLLRPERFGTEPTSVNAGKEWSHWFKTFQNFIEMAQGQDVLTSGDKLRLLTNYVSHSVYEYISECTSYEQAVKAVEAVYVKGTNEIFSRHLLATRKQQVGETIDQYAQSLRLLGRDCNFKAVSAEQNRDDYIRDALINGLCPMKFGNAC